MVKYTEVQLNDAFAALADPTRRAIIARLAKADALVTELAEPFAMSLPAITKHLNVLEQAGLISRIKEGRKRRCYLNPQPLKQAMHWLTDYEKFWSQSLQRLERYLNQTK